MKTTFILLVFLLLGFASEAKVKTLEYIVTNSDTLICKRIIVGNNYTRCVLNSGIKLKIENSGIIAYQHYGQLMERKPLVINGEVTGKSIFMQLIDVDNGIKIYRFTCEDFFNCEVYPVICFYKDDQLIEQQVNPKLTDIYDFVHEYPNQSPLLLSNE